MGNPNLPYSNLNGPIITALSIVNCDRSGPPSLVSCIPFRIPRIPYSLGPLFSTFFFFFLSSFLLDPFFLSQSSLARSLRQLSCELAASGLRRSSALIARSFGLYQLPKQPPETPATKKSIKKKRLVSIAQIPAASVVWNCRPHICFLCI